VINPVIESKLIGRIFCGRFRDECLNTNWFISLKHARDFINDWRKDYNEWRPHRSLDNLTPSQYLEEQDAQEGRISPILACAVLG
jgi:putative transposase